MKIKRSKLLITLLLCIFSFCGCAQDNTQVTLCDYAMSANCTTNLRSACDIDSEIVAEIPTDSNVLFVEDYNNGWVKISYNGKIGYSLKDNFSKKEFAEVSTTEVTVITEPITTTTEIIETTIKEPEIKTTTTIKEVVQTQTPQSTSSSNVTAQNIMSASEAKAEITRLQNENAEYQKQYDKYDYDLRGAEVDVWNAEAELDVAQQEYNTTTAQSGKYEEFDFPLLDKLGYIDTSIRYPDIATKPKNGNIYSAEELVWAAYTKLEYCKNIKTEADKAYSKVADDVNYYKNLIDQNNAKIKELQKIAG